VTPVEISPIANGGRKKKRKRGVLSRKEYPFFYSESWPSTERMKLILRDSARERRRKKTSIRTHRGGRGGGWKVKRDAALGMVVMEGGGGKKEEGSSVVARPKGERKVEGPSRR